jgi:hypothetical protein
MDAQLNEILSAINEEKLFVDTNKQIEPFHIYFKLKDFYKDSLTSADSLKMYAHHLKLEKCMSLMRQRNTGGALSMLAEVERLDRNFPVFVQKGMDSLYLAMSSYHDYIINDDVNEAIRKLRLSIKNGIIQSKDFPYFSLSIPTQWINILRVLTRLKLKDEIIKEGVELLNFTLFGLHNDAEIGIIYNNIGEAEHGLVITDVFDNVIYNLERSFEYEGMEEVLAIIIGQVVEENISIKSNHDNIIEVMGILNDFYKKNYDDFISKLYNQRGSLIDIPSSLKRIIINNCQKCTELSTINIYSEEEIFA